MLKANEIKDAVGALLQEGYPGEPVYTKLLPKDFERPSKHVEMVEKSSSAGACALTELTAKVRVVAFVPVDDYGDADDEVVDLAGDELMELFLGHTLDAADRRLTVEAIALEYGADYAGAVLTLHYMDDTPGREGPKRELMEHLHANGKKIV